MSIPQLPIDWQTKKALRIDLGPACRRQRQRTRVSDRRVCEVQGAGDEKKDSSCALTAGTQFPSQCLIANQFCKRLRLVEDGGGQKANAVVNCAAALLSSHSLATHRKAPCQAQDGRAPQKLYRGWVSTFNLKSESQAGFHNIAFQDSCQPFGLEKHNSRSMQAIWVAQWHAFKIPEPKKKLGGSLGKTLIALLSSKGRGRSNQRRRSPHPN